MDLLTAYGLVFGSATYAGISMLTEGVLTLCDGPSYEDSKGRRLLKCIMDIALTAGSMYIVFEASHTVGKAPSVASAREAEDSDEELEQ